MPANRRPLRERAKNQLRVNTSLIRDIRLNQPDVVQSLQSHRRRPSSPPYIIPRTTLIDTNTDAPSRTVIVIQPAHNYNTRYPRTRIIFIIKPGSAPPPPPPFKAFHALVPEISVAFSNGEYDPTTIAPPHHSFPSSSSVPRPEPFTHIIRIVHPSARISKKDCRYWYSEATAKPCSSKLTPGEVWVNYDNASRRAVLTVVTPPVPHVPGNISSLTHEQLVAARDFISLALPCFNAPIPREKDSCPNSPPPIPDPAHILITGPGEPSLPGRLIFTTDVREQTAADILSITTAYFAFAAPTPASISDVLLKLRRIIEGSLERAKRRRLERDYPETEDEGYKHGYFEREEDIKPWMPWISKKGRKMLKAVAKEWNSVNLARYSSE